MANAHTSRDKRPIKQADLRSTIQQIAHAKPDQLRDGYLSRLRRLLRLRRDHFEELNEQGLRLLDRSIFAAYCDCLDIGQGDAAKAVLKDVRLTLSLSRAKR
jgi:hypothetical protein